LLSLPSSRDALALLHPALLHPAASNSLANTHVRPQAVILLHQGELSKAAAELDAYMGSAHYKNAADPMDRALCRSMADLLGGVESLERVAPVSLEALLAGPSPDEARFDERKMPLTW
jgi:hypothetical protein